MESNKNTPLKTPKQKLQSSDSRNTASHPQKQQDPKPHNAKTNEHKNHDQSKPHQYRLEDFFPLIAIFGLIGLFTFARQWWYPEWHLHNAMLDFMGSFFLVFGIFKAINLKGFVEAYRQYDVITKHFRMYGYIYPFLEIALGVSYIMHFTPMWIHMSTLILMGISSIGVAQELLAKKQIICACLGAVFKIPMTWVTLLEDVLMAGMALWMMIR